MAHTVLCNFLNDLGMLYMIRKYQNFKKHTFITRLL